MPAFPSALPLPIADTYNEKLPDLVIRSTVDQGPGKVRKRLSAAIREVSFDLKLSLAELDDLIDFFLSDAAGGAISFTMTHPRTLNTETFRFTAPPEITYLSYDLYNVTVNLEMMP